MIDTNCSKASLLHEIMEQALQINQLEDLANQLKSRMDQTVEKQSAEIRRLREIITGALAWSFGPYSDTELLRRVVKILKTTGRMQ